MKDHGAINSYSDGAMPNAHLALRPIVGGRYNWKDQAERLTYMGGRRYPGDQRTWHQFAKIETPDMVWCEVLASDLQHFEESAPVHNS